MQFVVIHHRPAGVSIQNAGDCMGDGTPKQAYYNRNHFRIDANPGLRMRITVDGIDRNYDSCVYSNLTFCRGNIYQIFFVLFLVPFNFPFYFIKKNIFGYS